MKTSERVQEQDAHASGPSGAPPEALALDSADLTPDTPAVTLQRAIADPLSASPSDARALQRAYGNQFVQRLAITPAAGSEPAARRSGGASGGTVTPSVEGRIENQRGNGQPLPDKTRGSMENAFGSDFSEVRVHADSESTQLNRSLGARAFTTGSDIFFAGHEYQPESRDGQRLIAHELTHVVQQGGAAAKAPQAKLEVSAPDDEYEQEADATAARVTDNDEKDEGEALREESGTEDGDVAGAMDSARDEAEEEAKGESDTAEEAQGGTAVVDDTRAELEGELEQQETRAREAVSTQAVVAPSRIQRATIQRAEDDTAADVSTDEAALEADDEGEGENKQTEEEKEQTRQDSAKARQEGERDGRQKGEEEAPETDDDAPEEIVVPQPGVPAVPEAPVMPEEPVAIKSPDELEADQTAAEEFASTDSEALGLATNWDANQPPNWDEEVAIHEMFAAAIEAGPDATPDSVARTLMPAGVAGYVQREGGTSGAPAPTTTPAKDPPAGRKFEGGGWTWGDKPDVGVPVPKHENVFAQMVIGDTAGKGAEVINKFADVLKEKSLFGVLAWGVETAVKILELVTGILGLVTLAMTVVAGILFGIGLVFSLLPFGVGMGVAAALYSAATWIMGVVAKLSPWIIKLTIIRLKMRVVAVQLRLLDLLYCLATGQDVSRQLGIITDQVIGMAVDGASILLDKGMAKLAGSSAVASAKNSILGPATIGPKTLTSTIGSAMVPTLAATPSYFASMGLTHAASYTDEATEGAKGVVGLERSPSGVQRAPAGVEQDEEPVELTAPPLWAPAAADDIAIDLAGANAEKIFLQQRIATIDDVVVSKQQFASDMTTFQGELANNQQVLNTSDEITDKQMAASEQFADQAEETAGPARESKEDSEASGGALSGMKGDLNKGMDKAQSEGAAGNMDRGQVDNGPGTSREQAAQSEAETVQGAADAKAAKAASEQVKEKTGEARELATDANARVEEEQTQNLSEVDMLLEDKEDCLARLAEIESQEAELHSARKDTLDEASAWADDHRSRREENEKVAATAS